ncbi:hypothetical protein F5Y10DRAFT_290376 [Nemania abortiva]|nr:hypothetical protein F5Y10DRAFT_290376 [Nemania abortiva]
MTLEIANSSPDPGRAATNPIRPEAQEERNKHQEEQNEHQGKHNGQQEGQEKEGEERGHPENVAAPSVLANKQVYSKVVALVTCWSPKSSKNDRPHIAEEAQSLHDLFKDEFHFESRILQLEQQPKTALHNGMYKAIEDARIKRSDDELNLFIFYYGGYASAPSDMPDLMYLKSYRHMDNNDAILWHGPGSFLTEQNCDFLFIFDCCEVGTIISPEWKFRQRIEILASSGSSTHTKDYSFTKTLVSVLRASLPSDVATISRHLVSRDTIGDEEPRQGPVCHNYSKPPQSSIFLHRIGNMSDATKMELVDRRRP